ncbi:hypothetical protein [Mucilaginibacter lappiensis]|uniref:Uncharacterized protein n=1 Tax=Mucilaginibacter lappiensis TaxID=354630 RepID=A0A841JU51_9SPHI|nr:hypothetical protein [Mucilaginibacter lappiensis]MBB6131351.1 hypothetical protein [Mucilaginibacter lappiensis]
MKKRTVKSVPPTIEERLKEYYDDSSIQFQYHQIKLLESLGSSAQALIDNKDRMIRDKFADIYDLIKKLEAQKNQ